MRKPKKYLGQHGITLKYVSPIEIVIIGVAQFKHMLNLGTVPLHMYTHAYIPEYAFMHISMQASIHTCTCIHAYVHACVRVGV